MHVIIACALHRTESQSAKSNNNYRGNKKEKLTAKVSDVEQRGKAQLKPSKNAAGMECNEQYWPSLGRMEMNLVKGKRNEALTSSRNARSSPGTKGLVSEQNKMEQLAQSWVDEVENEANNSRDGTGRNITAPKASIWDKFDINKLNNSGYKLDYVKPIRTWEMVLVEIKEDDISSEIEYWKNTIMCYVLGAFPPFNVLNRFVQRKWGKLRINKVAMMKNGFFLVIFTSEEGKDEMLQGEIYHFDNKTLIVKEWMPERDFSKKELYSAPIWVKLLGLEFKY
ncbi:hypothetical protein BC332_28547 [Capsicum chinense]|nr:hypothetical protein BC332_28547 [Capsicum chinense]